ncbi:MAG: hypothetical protein K8953_13895, partial [Proteobacteria bacterium]|nr:hypothetical protein [Pseudomonadota bacterium]
ASVKRIGAGIWAGTNLGLLVPTVGANATWTGTLQTLKVTGSVVGSVRESDFTIQVDFVNKWISTLDSDGKRGGAITLVDGDTLEFDGTPFDAKGVIKANNAVKYKIAGAGDGYNLDLIGLIGQKGALGVFKGNLASASSGIVGGFEVTPTPRAINPNIASPTPKQINYATYFKYYVTDYTPTAGNPAVYATPSDGAGNALLISQFLQSEGDGTGLLTGTLTFDDPNKLNFSPFPVYLNGEDKTRRNGFVLVAGKSTVSISATRSYAGLLAGADVGRYTDALTGTAEWSGRFYSSAFISGTGTGRVPVRFGITLNVDFRRGRIGTDGDLDLSPGHSINIDGTF